MFINPSKGSEKVKKNQTKIWMWIEDTKLIKAVYNSQNNSLTIYNECDEILIRRKQITPEQMSAIERVFEQKHAKRIDTSNNSFTYIDSK